MTAKPLNRIVYAEDEPDIQEVATLALEVIGEFELKVCNTGQEAVDAVVEYQPDLLLFDVMMPGMDGPTAFQKIRQIPGMETIPVIFMTAKVQPQEVSFYKEIGALEVITKPFDPMTLAQTVRDAWSRQ
ncbi:MAG: response regulator [Magnetococcales bacterium]|nr:response regulator [Magnetococcales bacterium]